MIFGKSGIFVLLIYLNYFQSSCQMKENKTVNVCLPRFLLVIFRFSATLSTSKGMNLPAEDDVS